MKLKSSNSIDEVPDTEIPRGIEGLAQLMSPLGVILKCGVNFVIFVQKCPETDISSQNLCSSRAIFAKVTSAFQWLQPMYAMEYLIAAHGNERRVY